MYLQNRFIKVDRPMTPRVLQERDTTHVIRPPGCKRVFIKNIPYDCTEDDVKATFMVCGKIDGVRLAVWGHTNQLKGFGYVDFKSEESAEIAVKKSGLLSIKGRPVSCDFETQEAKRSFRSSDAKKKKASI
jgi:nucleolin